MPPNLDSIRERYLAKFGFELLVTDAQGKITHGHFEPTDCSCRGRSDKRRLQAAEQTRYWGETVINTCCDDGYAMWAVPILNNNQFIGSLLVQGVDLEGQPQSFHRTVQEAAHELLEIAIEENLINEAEPRIARERALKEHDRFLAIEATKSELLSDDIRAVYVAEEPGLLSSIKQGQIKEARSILNRILTGIYGLAGDRLELLKSSVLELVVMMSRAAVEAGALPSAVLGSNYRSLSELSGIDDEEDLADWVRRMMETLIESIRNNDSYPHSLLMLKAVRYMQGNLHKNLRRDEVARVAGVSPSHFSKLVTERLGRSFSSLLTQMRVTKAKELLVHDDRSLSEIAIECGFFDQSHFNKSFRAEVSMSPGEYRKSLE